MLLAEKSASSIVFRGTGLARSEEHTSELQSQSNLVCRLLLEKKKLLKDLPDEAIDSMLAAAGPGYVSALLSLELRHLLPAIALPARDDRALPAIEAPYPIYA